MVISFVGLRGGNSKGVSNDYFKYLFIG